MKLINFNELRARLGGRARSTIYEDLKYKRIPDAIKLGGKLYWEETQLNNWFKQKYAEAERG